MRRKRKVHRRHRNPVVRDGKVEFNAERRPGSAISNLCLLDGRVGIEHRLAADLVDAGIQMAADIGQHRTLQVFVLEEDRAPRVVCPYARKIRAQRIGIIEAGRFIDIEWWVWVGLAFFICRQRHCALPDLHLSCSRPANRKEHSHQQQRTERASLHQPLASDCGLPTWPPQVAVKSMGIIEYIPFYYHT